MGNHCQVLLSPKHEKILPAFLDSTRKSPRGWRLLETARAGEDTSDTVHAAAGIALASSSLRPLSLLILSVKLQFSEIHY